MASTSHDASDSEHPIDPYASDDVLIGQLAAHPSFNFPASMIEDRELMAGMLPGFRADLRLEIEYKDARSDEKLSCPIVALAGEKDNGMVERMQGWKECTTGSFRMVPVKNGEHLFLSQKGVGQKMMPTLAKEFGKM